MSLSLRQIEYVCTVVDCGSILAASRSLNVSTAQVLEAIDLAEASIGARMFDRMRATGLQLTPDGVKFVLAGRSLIAAQVAFQRQMGQMQTELRALRIGCFAPFAPLFMNDVVNTYRETSGSVKVSMLEGDQAELGDWLSRGLVDVVVAYDLGPSFNADPTPICRVPAHVLMSIDHPLAVQGDVTLAELAPHPLVMLDMAVSSDYVTGLFDMYGLTPQINFRARNYDTLRNAVAAGFGSAILEMRPMSEAYADDYRLIRLPLYDEVPVPTLQILDTYGTVKPRAVELLIDIVSDLFQGEDAGWVQGVVAEQAQHLQDA